MTQIPSGLLLHSSIATVCRFAGITIGGVLLSEALDRLDLAVDELSHAGFGIGRLITMR